MKIRPFTALTLVLLTGCGHAPAPVAPVVAPAVPERLREGQRVTLIAREGATDPWAGSSARGGKVLAVVSGGGFEAIPGGTPALVVADEHPEQGGGRTIVVVMERGEFAGRECRLARFFLETGGAP
jgi:hypothetical protein